MPDPHDTLSIVAEVSIALAGFSGIVVAFGRRSAKPLSNLEVRRLFNLFTLSGTSLVFSLVGVALLHIESMNQTLLWSWGSGLLVLFMGAWLVRDMIKVHRLEPGEKQGINFAVLTFFNSLAVVTLLLQLVNLVMLKQAWPFFLALVVIIGGAFQQFILLVHMEYRRDADRASQGMDAR